MAQKVVLKERKTLEEIYPITTTDCILGFEEIMKLLNTGSYSINFVDGTTAQELTELGSKIVDFRLENISSVKVVIGADKEDLTVGTVLPPNSLITWEVLKVEDDRPAVLWIKYENHYDKD